MADVILNTPRPSDGFSLSKAEQFITLPASHTPTFLWFGDSLAAGATDDARSDWATEPGLRYPDNPFERVNYGQFWGKRLTTGDGGANWSSAARLTTAATAATFQQLIPHIGGVVGEVSSQAYDSLDEPAASDVSLCPLWSFAQEIYGLFRDSAGEIVLPNFIMCARATTALGDVVAVGDHVTWSPARDGGTNAAWDMLTDGYITPAIAGTTGTPVLCGAYCSLGHVDGAGDSQYGGIADGLAAIFEDSLVAIRRELENFMNCETFPWLHTRFYRPASATSTEWTEIDTVNAALKHWSHTEDATRLVDISDLPRDADDIHPNGRGIYGQGRRIGAAYRELLQGSGLVVGREIS